MSISNNRISNTVESTVPFFVRNDHPNFVGFLEHYYKYLEQDEKTINTIKNLNTYQDVDLTIADFSEKLYSLFLKFLPEDALIDKDLLLKNVKDFYRAKGTEKATRFLMRILYNIEIDFYFPKKDILRASDGKWYVQKSIRVNDTKIENVANNTLYGLEKFIGTRIQGNTSNSFALVESVDRFFEQGVQVDELIISNIDGDFENGETVFALFNAAETIDSITANIFGGIVSAINIIESGTGYQIGDPVIILSNTGVGACATVSSVTTGNIASITVINGGAGYRNNDVVLVTGGGGTGANANVSSVLTDESIHPNSYNIIASLISFEANTLLNNTVYSNLNSSNANVTIANATNTWVYGNTGPARSILVLSPGTGYSTDPTLSIVANSVIFALGILGRMSIVNGGQNYTIGDQVEFFNVYGGYGAGAIANVTNVDMSSSNSISQVRFVRMTGHLIGGSGYDQNYLPTANVRSATGNGANVIVTAILGSGSILDPETSSIGGIERITLISGGTGYDTNTTIDLTDSGDGTATANAIVVAGVYSYPGRYLNDDGHLSSYNFLENRDYYQTFSYVIKSTESISRYRQVVNEIIHPAGLKMFGEYTYVKDSNETESNTTAANIVSYITKLVPYVKTGNTYNISYTSHGISANANVYLNFVTGNTSNFKNGIKMVVNSQPNFFTALQKSNLKSITITNGGASYNSNSYLIFVGDGNGANVYYNVNATGAIVSVTMNDSGINFTYPPTITANGSNSIPAVFTSIVSYHSNTSGNVYVSNIFT